MKKINLQIQDLSDNIQARRKYLKDLSGKEKKKKHKKSKSKSKSKSKDRKDSKDKIPKQTTDKEE